MTISFKTISVEEADFDAEILANLFEYINERKLNVHTLSIIKSGAKVIDTCAHPFRKDIPRETYSMSKSFVSIAIGIAENQGLLSLDDKVISFFPDKADDSLKYLKELTIEDLLTMTVGFDFFKNNGPIWDSEDWIKAFLNTPFEMEPGKKFDYNNFATFMLSAIIKKVTGLRVRDYLYENFFKELGIKKPVWKSRYGIDVGFSGLFLTPEDEEKIAYCLLNPDYFTKNNILDAAYFRKATSKQIATKWYPVLCQFNCDSGYGYQYWISERYNGFNSRAMLAQRITVIPELGVAIVLHCGDNRLGYFIDEYIVPACKKGYKGGLDRLNKAIAEFEKPDYKSFRVPDKRKHTYRFYNLDERIDRIGILDHEYRVDGIGYKQTEDELILYIKDEGKIYGFKCGLENVFIENKQKLDYNGEVMETYPHFRGKWINEDRLYIETQRLTIPWRPVLDITFKEDKVEVLATHEENGHGRSSETFYGSLDNTIINEM